MSEPWAKPAASRVEARTGIDHFILAGRDGLSLPGERGVGDTLYLSTRTGDWDCLPEKYVNLFELLHMYGGASLP